MTPRQSEVLKVIQVHWEETGFAPTLREICKRVGLKSYGRVHAIVTALEDRGYVTTKHNLPRSVCLTADGQEIITKQKAQF